MEGMIEQCTQMMSSMNNMMEDGMMNGMRQGGMIGGMMTPWGTLGWLLIIGVVVALALGIIWVAQRSSRPDQPGDTPLIILKRRYAAGEIDSQQFEEMKSQLAEG